MRPPFDFSGVGGNGIRTQGGHWPCGEGCAKLGGHATKCKGQKDFLQVRAGDIAVGAETPHSVARTLGVFRLRRDRNVPGPRGWTVNCTVPLRESRSTVGPVKYQTSSASVRVRTPHAGPSSPETGRGRVYPSRLRRVQKGVLRYRSGESPSNRVQVAEGPWNGTNASWKDLCGFSAAFYRFKQSCHDRRRRLARDKGRFDFGERW